MKLKFGVDQAACFRKGVDASRSVAIIEVNPAEVAADIRGLISDYLRGIEVHRLAFSERAVDSWQVAGPVVVRPYGAFHRNYRPDLIQVPGLEFDDLVAAILANEQHLERQWGVEQPHIWTRDAVIEARKTWQDQNRPITTTLC